MKWPWTHDRTHRDREHDRADRALKDTAERRAETEERDRSFNELADRIRRMRERNHLAEAVEAALREGR